MTLAEQYNTITETNCTTVIPWIPGWQNHRTMFIGYRTNRPSNYRTNRL